MNMVLKQAPAMAGKRKKVKSSLCAIKFSNVGGCFESFITHRKRQTTHSVFTKWRKSIVFPVRTIGRTQLTEIMSIP